MATIEIPSSDSIERDIPTGIAPATLEEVVRYGEGLGDDQYLVELQRLIGHDVLITTVSSHHISPLQHNARFPVPFMTGAIAFNQFPTTLHDVHRGEIFFPYEHTFRFHNGESQDRVVDAVAPMDRTVTTVFLPA